MMNFFTSLFKAFATLSPARKISLVGSIALTLAGIGLLVYFANQVEYGILFSNLSAEDAGSIVAKLQEKKVPYKVSAAGETISVPKEQVAELRLEMASTGLPQGGGVGFEIFDRKNLGATDFEQQLNYRRALQGELSRSINGLEEIVSSRVHIAIPKDSLFVEEQKKATAAVTVRLRPGKSLRPAQIEGIAHLVAGSVDGLSAEDVMIIDGKGNILSKSKSDGKLAGMTNSQIEYQRNVEKDLSSRIQSLLENAVGPGKAVARVAADIDFSVMEKTEETFDAENPVVRSMQKQTERTTGSPSGKTAKGGTEKEKSDEIVNYEINKVINKTIMPTGEIKKLSIAVLVDGMPTKDGSFQERPKKDLEALEDLVRKSAGFNASRGDQVVVSCLPFSGSADGREGAEDGGTWQDWFGRIVPVVVKYLSFLAIAMAAFLLVIRPLVRMLLSRAVVMESTALQALSGDEHGALPSLEGRSAEPRSLTEADIARQMAMHDAKSFAELLRNWLK
jgi:flagellar M-ring protein FliF